MTTVACWNFNNALENLGVFDDVTTVISPVGWWKMNDNLPTTVVVDETGLHNGVLTGGNTSAKSVTGRINQALQLDGSGDYITIADHADFDFGIDDFSIAFWLKTISAGLSPNQEYGIINKNSTYQGSAGWGIELSTWAGVSTPSFSVFNTGQSTWGNSNVYKLSWVNDVWHHVVFERVGGALHLFVDGVLAASKNHDDCALNVDNTQPIVIGDHSWGPETPMVIDDLRIYRGALDATTIATLAAGTESVVTANVGAHNGRVIGSVPLINGPISNRARSFPGVNGNYVRVPSHAAFTSSTPKTYEIWFSTPGSLSGSYRFLIMKMPGSGLPSQVGFHLVSGDPSQMYFYVRDVSSNTALATSPTGTVVASRLHYMAGTWNPTTKTCMLYSNGVYVAQATNLSINTSQVDTTEDLTIGGTTWSGQPWNSLIHAVRVSDVVKTAKEIYDTYHGANVQESP